MAATQTTEQSVCPHCGGPLHATISEGVTKSCFPTPFPEPLGFSNGSDLK